MSAEEDTELRDLVAQSLESKGVLGKIRAQLRASVFLALEEQQEEEEIKVPLSNPNLKKFLNTSEGRLVAGLVREFLEFFDLDFTIAVFDPESSFSDRYQGRNNLSNELKFHETDRFGSKPLLLEVVQRLLHGSSNSGNTTSLGGKLPSSINETQSTSSTSRQNGPLSPRSSSPSSAKEEEEKTHSELMISAGFESDDDMKPSKIPQRIKDDKSVSLRHSSENGLHSFGNDKLDMKDKSLSDSRKDTSGRGSPDRTIGSDDEDIFSDFPTKPKSTLQTVKRIKETESEKTSLDIRETAPRVAGGLSSLKGAPPLTSGGLGSLKDAPPLQGATTIKTKEFPKSPDWNDLAEIDSRINKLGFDISGEEKSTNSQEYDYEDDFQASSSHLSDHTLSLTEEIEEQLSSYHSNSSKADDPLTTDRTVSCASDNGLDYAEDIFQDL